MNQHYSEADLLETWYTQPGASMPVMMHLADCSACAARYERLERKIRALAACEHEKPESFWSRQRILVMRRIDAQSRRPAVMRIAAAAALAFVLGGTVSWPVFQQEQQQQQQPSVVATQSSDVAAEPASTVPSDPWESDQLDDYRPIIEWESWVETSGGRS